MECTYSLFHQILGVAFFQIAKFKICLQNFCRIIFPSSPNIVENLVEVCCVFCKLDNLACNNFDNTQIKFTKFSGKLGEKKK